MPTAPFWSAELGAIAAKHDEVRQMAYFLKTKHRDHANAAGTMDEARQREAVEQFEQARRQQPESADVEFKWGLVYVMHGRPTEALSHFERARALQPEDAEMPHAMGRALLALGRRTDAVAQFEAALRLNPNHAGAHEALNLVRSGSPNAR